MTEETEFIDGLRERMTGIAAATGKTTTNLGDMIMEITRSGGFIDCTFYVQPGVFPDKVLRSVQGACVELFGSKPDPEKFELWYNNPNEFKLSYEIDGNDVVCHAFGLSIKPPESKFYSTETLTNQFTLAIEKRT